MLSLISYATDGTIQTFVLACFILLVISGVANTVVVFIISCSTVVFYESTTIWCLRLKFWRPKMSASLKRQSRRTWDCPLVSIKLLPRSLSSARSPYPLDDDLEASLKSINLTPLKPFLPLSQVFPRVKGDRLHIVVQVPTNSKPMLVFLHVTDNLIDVVQY